MKMRTEDGEIIQQCLDGKSTAFGFLVDKYKKSVYALAYSEIRNFHDAQDVTQEVFLKAYRNLHTLRRWDNFMGWLCRITVNICRDWVRSESKRPDNEYLEDQEPAVLENPSMESYRQDIMSEAIHDALESLPEIYRQVMTLRYFGGMTVREMSNFLGVSTTTIERRVSEGQSRLKEEILTMMTISKQRHDLPASFTFQIIEAIKNIRIQPIPSTSLPWGLSLAIGMILAVLSIGSHINISGSLPEMVESLLSGREYAVTIGDFMPFRSFSHQAGFGSGNNGDGNGIVPVLLQGQKLPSMAPAEGGKIPEKPSFQIGNGLLDGLAYSPDGKTLAVLTTIGVKLYDADNLNEIGILQEDKSYRSCVAFSPDGKILVVGNGNGGFSLWNMQTKKLIGSIPDRQGYFIAFTPDSKTLAMAEWGKTINIWDIQKLEQIAALKVVADYTYDIAFASDGKTLVSVGSNNDPIRLWDIQTQKQIGKLKGNKHPAHRIAVSPDGKLVTAGGDENEGELLIWNVQEQKLIGSLNGHKSEVNSISFSSDGKTLASGSYNEQTIRLWDIQEQRQIALISANKSECYKIALKPDGKTVASLNGDDKLVRFWNVQDQKEAGIISGFAYYPLVAFSPDSKTFASGGGSKITLWNTEDQKQTAEIPVTEIGGYAELAFSLDGKILAGSTDKSIYLVDVEKQKQIGLLNGHTDYIRSIAFSPDGKLIASGSLDMTLRLWDVQQQKEIWKQNCPSHTHSVAFSPDGKYVASGIGGNGSIIIWDVKTKNQTDVLQTPGWVISIAFSPDGQTLVSGIGSISIIFWDFKKERQIGSIGLGNVNYIGKLMFSPDGKWLVSDLGGICYIWDAKTREQLANIKGHKGLISSMSLSPNGKWLATASYDGTILLWEVDIPVQSKAVSPMGKAIGTWGDVKKDQLFQNYPNPFNPETWIPFTLSKPENVRFKIYNSAGQLVRTLDLGNRDSGDYLTRDKSAYWDGKNNNGESVSSDTYYVVMQAGDFIDTKKMVMVK